MYIFDLLKSIENSARKAADVSYDVEIGIRSDFGDTLAQVSGDSENIKGDILYPMVFGGLDMLRRHDYAHGFTEEEGAADSIVENHLEEYWTLFIKPNLEFFSGPACCLNCRFATPSSGTSYMSCNAPDKLCRGSVREWGVCSAHEKAV